MRKVAFFDVDGTVFRSSLLIELIEALIERDQIPEAARNMYIVAELSWKNREGSFEQYIASVIKAFMKHIKGVSYKSFGETIEEVITHQKKRVYTFTRDLIRDLKKKKYYLVAVSQSPKGILDAFCREYGFDKIYGRFYELGPQDRFTGGVIDEHLIMNKSNIVKRVIEREKLTLKNSISVGDTEGDIPMLDLVENPICFNPNQKLYKHAKRNGWKIVVERKDVIYEL